MKHTILLALAATLVAVSAPTVQATHHPETVTQHVQDAAQSRADLHHAQVITATPEMLVEADAATATATLEAAGCCDQGYEVKTNSSSFTEGCCDQGYEVRPFLPALVSMALLLAAFVYARLFNTRTASWT